ncbi:MAG: type II secretion system protein [Lentisphaerota bacterium]
MKNSTGNQLLKNEIRTKSRLGGEAGLESHISLLRNMFTMVELLVVITIISILAAMLLPALSKAKDVAKSILCINNLKHIGLATFSYGTDWGELAAPPAFDTNEQAGKQVWTYKLEPYTGIPAPGCWDFKDMKGIWKCTGSGLISSSRTVLNGIPSTYGINGNLNAGNLRYSAFATSAASTTTQYNSGGIKTFEIKYPSTLGVVGCTGWEGPATANLEYRPSLVSRNSAPDNFGLGFWHSRKTNIYFFDGHAVGQTYSEALAPKTPAYGCYAIFK